MDASTYGEQELMITRSFEAPPEVIWKYWTEPEAFKQWWGPEGFTCTVAEIDLRVGGRSFSNMVSPEGQEFWSTGVYEEIVPPERLVMTDSFADENGNIVPASYYGMPGELPLELRIIVTFTDIEGRTKMTLRHLGFPPGEMQDQAKQGWEQSFDKLTKLIEQRGRAAA